ncbi:hypothetical protein TIFTF001_032976 [Ficus carica]|uniref:Uncharacterized protein n=1 Tax=Ficus carica TaxID=3494 RepID=A0AA88DY62_FICCA|nr:hypothetical protein TIFTF001_032976 [Ficus carica]
MHCLVSYNVDPVWDELDLDDHEEDNSKANTLCDSNTLANRVEIHGKLAGGNGWLGIRSPDVTRLGSRAGVTSLRGAAQKSCGWDHGLTSACGFGLATGIAGLESWAWDYSVGYLESAIKSLTMEIVCEAFEAATTAISLKIREERAIWRSGLSSCHQSSLTEDSDDLQSPLLHHKVAGTSTVTIGTSQDRRNFHNHRL